ncbi:MAG TPA: DUF2203 domain-containing protein [Actinomycetota bacterium]
MRTWTVEEANAALPRVSAAVERVRALAARATAGREQGGARARGNGHAPAGPVGAELAAAIDELTREDIVLRDLDSGLLDFPAVSPSGRAYWLCWLPGEPEVAWWHWPEAGFAGRTPLDQPPR